MKYTILLIFLQLLTNAFCTNGQPCNQLTISIVAVEPFSLYQEEVTASFLLNLKKPNLVLESNNSIVGENLFHILDADTNRVLSGNVYDITFHGIIVLQFKCGTEMLEQVFLNAKGEFILNDSTKIYRRNESLVTMLKEHYGLRNYLH